MIDPSQTFETRRRAIQVSVACWLTVAVPMAMGQSDGKIGATGGKQITWIYAELNSPSPETPFWRFAFRIPSANVYIGWIHPPGFGDAVGDIAATAVRGDRLDVIYADGTHRIYEPRDTTFGRQLPRRAVPIAMTGDDARDSIYAVVPTHIADALDADEPAPSDSGDPQTSLPSDEPRDGDGAGARHAKTSEPKTKIQPATPSDVPPESPFALLRYDMGRWHYICALPESVQRADGLFLSVANGMIDIVFPSAQPNAGYLFATINPEGANGAHPTGWSTPETINGLATGSALAALSITGHTVIVRLDDADRTVSTLSRDGDTWIAGKSWSFEGNAWNISHDTAAFATHGDSIAAVWRTDEAGFRWGRWNVAGGPAIGGEHPVRALSADGRIEERRRTNSALSRAVLAIVLVTLFIRRKQSVFSEIPIGPDIGLAGYVARLSAFTIDALLILPGIMYAYSPLFERFDYDITALLLSARSDADLLADLSWRWLATVAAFVTFTSVFELLWGATPGKRLLKCYVVTEQGSRCSATQVLIRNAVRFLELYPFATSVWTMMLVLLTRNRQRLGDLIGRTLVVQRCETTRDASPRSL